VFVFAIARREGKALLYNPVTGATPLNPKKKAAPKKKRR
jgi:hypothetical protein